MTTQTYTDPHDPTRTITVKAVTRAFGQLPGQPAPADEPLPALTTEVLLNGDRIVVIGHWRGFTDVGIRAQALYYAITKGAKESFGFKAYSAARHWLWLDSEARESRAYRMSSI